MGSIRWIKTDLISYGILPPYLWDTFETNASAASTTSSFTVYLTAVNSENQFLSWMPIHSEDFQYNATTGERHFSLHYDCVPRADLVFIRFDNQPEDAWAIDEIFVDTNYSLGPLELEQKWHFEHPILIPCASWLDRPSMYQIGPRNGLFIRYDYHHN
ncbi:hypothetical protein OSTOST_12054, partial [Ostertagia ostertagi]